MRASLDRLRRGTSGQVVGFAVLSLVCLLGVGSLVVDGGRLYLEKRRAQSAADAAALAAVLLLPNTNANLASATSSQNLANFSEGAIAYSQPTGQARPTVIATATTTLATIFGRVLGIGSARVTATATAVREAPPAWGYLLPWAVDQDHATPNTSETVKVDPGNQVSPGNFGAVSFPQYGNGCATYGGTTGYRDMITGAATSCALRVGELIDPKTGAMGNNTQSALDAATRGIVHPFDASTIYQPDGNGSYTITDPHNPNLGVIPIVESFYNGSSQQLKIVGFAYFIITDYTATTVTGVLVRRVNLPQEGGCPHGDVCGQAYDAPGGDTGELVG